MLLIFPEAYPTIDPHGNRKSNPRDFVPFDAGFLALAERAGQTLPLVPVGLCYSDKGKMWLRFGQPFSHSAAERRLRRVTLRAMEAEVRRLSLPPMG